jgi:hypothetical protein
LWGLFSVQLFHTVFSFLLFVLSPLIIFDDAEFGQPMLFALAFIIIGYNYSLSSDTKLIGSCLEENLTITGSI